MTRYLLWDFDGTLGHREDGWSGALCDALLQHEPGLYVTPETIRPHILSGFRWHKPELDYRQIFVDQEWWDELNPLFYDVLAALKVNRAETPFIIADVREQYLRPQAWRVSEDADAVLKSLAATGWKHVITSNHVAELPQILEYLGLASHFDAVFCSSRLGVEKPHPKFMKLVLSAIEPYDAAWVIGDSLNADVGAARNAGLPSILVGSFHEAASHSVPSIRGVPEVLRV